MEDTGSVRRGTWRSGPWIVAIVLLVAGAGLTSLASAQTITEFPIPTAFSRPYGIAVGPDGNLWFTEDGGNVGRITPRGVITEFPVPTSGGSQDAIAAGSDGNLWFTEDGGNNIGRITPVGAVTEIPIPTSSSHPWGITAGPDGNLWFTESAGDKIGRITPDGVVTRFAVPTRGHYPAGITAGPDGNLWFTEYFGNTIGRFTPPGAATFFFTVPPCRAFDSRDSIPFAGGSWTVPLVGRCGVPTGAVAVALNLTVTAATTAGHIVLFADGQEPWPLVSTINYVAGQTRANNAVAQLGASGATAVYVSQLSGTVHVIIDVSGYFMSDSAPPSP
jgi:sugar lactone lactonase YvrE